MSNELNFPPSENLVLIGVMSDSHDNLPRVAQAVEYFNRAGVELVIHAGDIISPFCSIELKKLKAPFIAVFGNNDGEHIMWQEMIKGWGEIHTGPYGFEWNGSSVLVMHGPSHIDELAAEGKYDLIVYGHTHKVDRRAAGKTLILNPGECGGWLSRTSTVATVGLPEKTVNIVDLDAPDI